MIFFLQRDFLLVQLLCKSRCLIKLIPPDTQDGAKLDVQNLALMFLKNILLRIISCINHQYNTDAFFSTLMEKHDLIHSYSCTSFNSAPLCCCDLQHWPWQSW